MSYIHVSDNLELCSIIDTDYFKTCLYTSVRSNDIVICELPGSIFTWLDWVAIVRIYIFAGETPNRVGGTCRNGRICVGRFWKRRLFLLVVFAI